MAKIAVKAASLEFPDVFSNNTAKSAFLNLFSGKEKVVPPALSELNFEFQNGDRVGLIGGNGAGKSTLLRLLAGIYSPTSGRVDVEGGVSTLLDLNLGMDDDASGYENIDIVCSLLGVPSSNLSRVVQDVEKFTELGEHLYKPVRSLSSGMRMRLAFSLATNGLSDIVLIDEIIGVGDANFMDKAAALLHEQSERASILVLASHAPGVLKSFCNIGMVLHEGKIMAVEPIERALEYYNLDLQVIINS